MFGLLYLWRFSGGNGRSLLAISRSVWADWAFVGKRSPGAWASTDPGTHGLPLKALIGLTSDSEM